MNSSLNEQPPSNYTEGNFRAPLRLVSRSNGQGYDNQPLHPKTPGRGHETVLTALREKGKTTNVVLLSGKIYVGRIVANDAFTITLLMDDVRRIFYKHAIESFYTDAEPPQFPTVQ